MSLDVVTNSSFLVIIAQRYSQSYANGKIKGQCLQFDHSGKVMSKDHEGYDWVLSGMNEFGEVVLCMNCVATSYSELSGPLANLASAREALGVETILLTCDNPSKDGPSLLSSLSLTSLPPFKFAGQVLLVVDEPSCALAFNLLGEGLRNAPARVAGLDVEYVTYFGRDQLQGAECNHKYADLAQICVGDVCVLVFFNAPAVTDDVARAALYPPFQAILADANIQKVIIFIIYQMIILFSYDAPIFICT